MMNLLNKYFFCSLILILLYGCNHSPKGEITRLEKAPDIDPDYTGIVIPPNIAPMNFSINGESSAFCARFLCGTEQILEVFSKNGQISIPRKKWKKMLKEHPGQNLAIEVYILNDHVWSQYNTINNKIAEEPVDPYLSYRLLYPGYEAYKEISINQRCIENFEEHSLIENSIADDNCVNCHTLNPGNNDNYLFHMRGTLGGTYIYNDKELTRINLKTKDMPNNAVYARWHPSGKFIAFSSNKTVQFFHSADNKKVEVADVSSSLILYSIGENEVKQIDFKDKERYMDTYPEWSPDGKYLYFCRATLSDEEFEYTKIKYNLYRISFDSTALTFGEPEMIFDAEKLDKSISFPRISPDGKYLVLTLHNYGCFPIWHKEADLYSIDLNDLTFKRLESNSDFTESYHSWSSNGKWLMFSSKRMDGLTARPFITYIDDNGNASKPFVLPQKDPEFYQNFLKTFNLPEFSTMKLKLNPGELRRAVKSEAIQSN